MSLVGNLEDLGLGDILQIVSLSQKSGLLALERDGVAATICFSKGQIIRASSSMMRLNLGDLLVMDGLVELETVKTALRSQRREGGFRCIGTILSEDFGVDRDRIETVVRRQIEAIVLNCFSWAEGTFSFDLGEQRILGEAALNPLSFMFTKGLNPQWLALEGSKNLDEGGLINSLDEGGQVPVTDWSALLAVGEEAGTDTLDAAAATSAETVLVIDDDPALRQALGRALGCRGLTCALFGEMTALLRACDEQVNAGRQPLVLVDLIMPRPDGAGILGGLDVIERLRAAYPLLSIFLMSDHRQAVSAERLHRLGVPAVLDKPKKQELTDARAPQLLDRLIDGLLAIKAGGGSPDNAEAPVDLVGELLQEIGEPVTGRSTRDQGPASSQGLRLLKGLLQELAHPGPGGEIVLLVLRFASELMSRAMLLGLRGEALVDMGQFGFDLSAWPGGFRLPVAQWRSSALGDLLKHPRPLRLDGPAGVEWVREFRGSLPTEVFLAPLVAEGRVIALLYGDNANDGRPMGDTEALEIFLSQAGLAMARAQRGQQPELALGADAAPAPN